MESKDIISSGLLELYAMGLASEQEALQVLQWKKDFPEVAAELLSIEEGLEQYAVANSKPVSTKAKNNFINFLEVQNNQVQNETVKTEATIIPLPIKKEIAKPNYFKWVAAASIALLLGSTIGNYFLYNKANKIQNDLTTIEKKLADKNIIENEANKNLKAVFSSEAVPVVLKGQPIAPTADARIFYLKNTGEVYVEPSGLPEAPKGKQYQLWAIVDGKPVDGGMIKFETKNNTYKVQQMKTFGKVKVQAFAITLEDEGGKPTPDMNNLYVMNNL